MAIVCLLTSFLRVKFLIYILLLQNCCAQQSGDGYNIYKDFQIGKSNDVLLKEDETSEVLKDELVLPSVAAKVNVDDTSKRNTAFRNFMITREIPAPEILEDEVITDPVYSLVMLPESKVTVPRVVKNFGLRPVEKKSGIFGHGHFFRTNDQYNKRSPGSVLTWTLTSSRPVSGHLRQDSGKQTHFLPSSFVATMGK